MKTVLPVLIFAIFFSSHINAKVGDASTFAFKSPNGPAFIKAVSLSRNALVVKSKKQAASMVKSRYKAKVLSISVSNGNGAGYRAKLLGDDGTVFYVYIDAKTGKMKRS